MQFHPAKHRGLGAEQIPSTSGCLACVYLLHILILLGNTLLKGSDEPVLPKRARIVSFFAHSFQLAHRMVCVNQTVITALGLSDQPSVAIRGHPLHFLRSWVCRGQFSEPWWSVASATCTSGEHISPSSQSPYGHTILIPTSFCAAIVPSNKCCQKEPHDVGNSNKLAGNILSHQLVTSTSSTTQQRPRRTAVLCPGHPVPVLRSINSSKSNRAAVPSADDNLATPTYNGHLLQFPHAAFCFTVYHAPSGAVL